MSEPLSSTQAEQRAEPAPIRCPLLLSHLETRNPNRRMEIADAAPASASTLRAYSDLTGRFAFLGVADDLEPDGAAPLGALEGGLALYGGTSLDLVLLWDLPNYCEATELSALARLLRAHLRPGGRVHMLIASSLRQIPALPALFQIEPGWSGVLAAISGPLREAPRFTPWQIEQAFAGFEVERSVLLRSGMQEYLLRLRMGAAGGAE